jgi:hypothetical protein
MIKNKCLNIIFILLFLIFLFLIGYFFYNIWNEKNEDIKVVEKFKNTIKLNCRDLQSDLKKLFYNRSRLIREYIIVSLNNLSVDEKNDIVNTLNINTKNICNYFKYILGCEQLYKLLNVYNNTLLNFIDSYISPDSSEESKKQLQLLSNDNNSIILYLNTNLIIKDEEEVQEVEENIPFGDPNDIMTSKPIPQGNPKDIMQVDTNNYLKSVLKNNLKFTIQQLNDYYYKKYSSSENSFENLINNYTLLADCLTDLLCKISKNN